MDFQKDLRKAIIDADPKLKKDELLIDIFKSFVAKMFEFALSRAEKNESRLTMNQLVSIKHNLISEFRSAELGEHQQSVEWYDDLFEQTVKEIYESAAHQGIETVQRASQNLEINPEAYKFEKGIYRPN